MPEMYDTIIIGAGVAGLGAAIYSGRFEMKTLLISENIGGTIMNTNEVANYPGFNLISGIDLVDKLQNHVKDYKVDIENKKVDKVEKTPSIFKVKAQDKTFESKTVIFATGTEWRKLNVPGEKEFSGKGVHYCALCDGSFYKDKAVAVVGGSDSAAKDALLLTQYAKKVYIIYRKEKIRAEPITKAKVDGNEKIEVINNTNVTEIRGEKFVNKLILDNEYNNSKEFPIDAVFIDIGHIPISDLAKGTGVELDEKGEVKLDRRGFTNIEGAFAAGDVTNTRFKQAITGVAEGVTAAYNAYNHVDKGNVIDRGITGR
ncbi:thioredoxin-disulfide reductase [Candidatus Woesearchaeota archaeon]|nr:thioredoxin-disulfide reductase [Candidatus Woesearchaeota archaeon]